MSDVPYSEEGKTTLCQVIPTLNEGNTIAVLIEKLEELRNKLPFELKLVVVDDNSTDGTIEKIKDLQMKYDNLSLVQRPLPSGIGSAYLDGFSFSIKTFNPEFLGEIDGDLQHPPEVLIEMSRLAAKGVDVVVASRYVAGGGAADWNFGRKLVSRGANLLTKIFLRIPVKDSTSGYRILSRRAIDALSGYIVSSKGYSFQVESLYAYKKSGMSFAEVPYNFEIRRSGRTKLNRKEMWTFAKTTVWTGLFGLKKS